MKKKFILFDFDGVIVDSFRPAFEIQKMICPHLTENIYRKRFEGNINDWEEPTNVHTEECRHNIDFFTKYIPRMKNEVQIVPGMKEVIIELEKNYTLVVISSTITSPIQEFLEGHDLATHFAQIMGNDVHKSKIEKMAALCNADCNSMKEKIGLSKYNFRLGITDAKSGKLVYSIKNSIPAQNSDVAGYSRIVYFDGNVMMLKLEVFG